MQQKRLVTIQDLSCFGKCSISVALPVISALGHETVVLPTAVLSTHTGGFKDYTFFEFTDEFEKIQEHWYSMGLEFDAIYVGYIGSVRLIEAVEAFIDRFRKNAVVFIDPAMADNGLFYSGLDSEYSKRLKKLLEKADIISPNYTEALILSGYSPDEKGIELKDIFKKLSPVCKNVIVTGVHDDNNIITASKEPFGEIKKAVRPFTEGNFYGSGDLFASAFIGLYLKGLSLESAVEKATSFVSDCIQKTLDEREKYSYGLKFEQSLGMLTR